MASLVWISVTVRRKRNNLRMYIRHLLVVVVLVKHYSIFLCYLDWDEEKGNPNINTSPTHKAYKLYINI